MISIIIPVYNVELYIDRCIESIMNQTYRDFELLLINDGSTDQSGILCDYWARKDSRIRVFHKCNGGVSSARNFGISRAYGEYLSFIDPDDWVEYDMLSKMVDFSKRYKADIVVCGGWYDYENRGCQAFYPATIGRDGLKFEARDAIKNMLTGNFILGGLCNKLYNKNLFFNVVLKENLMNGEDVVCNVQLMLQSNRVIYIPYMLYHYRQRSDSVTYSFDFAKLSTMFEAYHVIYDCLVKNMYDLQECVASAAFQYYIYLTTLSIRNHDEKFFLQIQLLGKSDSLVLAGLHHASTNARIHWYLFFLPYKLNCLVDTYILIPLKKFIKEFY